MLKSSSPKEIPLLNPSRISVKRWSKSLRLLLDSGGSTWDGTSRPKSSIPKGSESLAFTKGSAPKMSASLLNTATPRGWIGGGDTKFTQKNLLNVIKNVNNFISYYVLEQLWCHSTNCYWWQMCPHYEDRNRHRFQDYHLMKWHD